VNQNDIPKLERLRNTLTDLIAFAEKKTVEADDQDRDILQLEHDGDLPAPIMDARVQLALLDRLLAQPVQAGHQLVPTVPTTDMVIDGFEAVSEFRDSPECAEMSGCRASSEAARICYLVMLASARGVRLSYRDGELVSKFPGATIERVKGGAA